MPMSSASSPSAGPARPGAPVLDQQECDLLLRLACATVAVVAGAAPRSTLGEALDRTAWIVRRGAAFVTLTENGELRGCVGHLDADSPIADSIIEAAMAATRHDPRFPGVRPAELPRIHVEVSLLGPMVPIDEPTSFELGIEGIVVTRGGLRGLLLPEVATDHGLGREQMLSIACDKAGLPSYAWRDPATRVLAFRTLRFGGPAEPPPGENQCPGVSPAGG